MYETDLGRFNFDKRTPMGSAKFYQSTEAIAYLETQFIKTSSLISTANKEDEVQCLLLENRIQNWEPQVDYLNHRTFVNKVTGEVSELPPYLSAQRLMEASPEVVDFKRRAIRVVRSEALTKKEYLTEVKEHDLIAHLLS